ncbi:MAG: ATPase, T2SS/T4P/T4SS family [Promethearchaeota archaeon]
MSINLKRNKNSRIKESLNVKNENSLIIECINCSEITKELHYNENCVLCFLENLYYNKNKTFKYISIEAFDNLIESKQILFFLEYFKKLKKIKHLYQKIENFKLKKCIFKGFKCKIFPNYLSFFKIEDKYYYDPLLLYNIIQKKIRNINNKHIIDSICQNCIDYLKNLIKLILRILDNLTIIKQFNDFQTKDDFSQRYRSFYDFLFSRNYQLGGKKKHEPFNGKKHDDLIEIYNVGKNDLFQISIFNIIDEAEKKYEVELSFSSIADKIYFERIIENVLKNLEIFKLDRIIPLEDLIKIYSRESLKFISSKFNFSKKEISKIGFYASLKKLHLEKVFPLLIDDNIEEVFLDSPDEEIYINHQKYGRCRTELRLTLKEIERIKTLLRLYSNQRLDYMNPSIKYVMKNKYFYCRFAIDVEPVHLNNFALDVRKLNKNILTIQDLLKNKTLNPLMAAFLYFSILRRMNLTATGETDTGKTTLINAFDLLTPKDFRKIYVENVTESLNQFEFCKHQLKYQANSLDASIKKKYSKSNHIKTLLHRTPDIIYLGEILTKEEAEAMFHCLAAGLRGFQTIHSNTIHSLINRFLYHFKINISCLNDLDLLILLKKDFYKRRVVSISEINLNNHENNNYCQTIFKYNPELKNWDNLIPLYETNTIQKLKKFENLDKKKFKYIINIYLDIFEFLSKIKKITNMNLVNLFHKISYYSMSSINLLEDFWNRWKKNRSLNS